jgi:hypothetical protein
MSQLFTLPGVLLGDLFRHGAERTDPVPAGGNRWTRVAWQLERIARGEQADNADVTAVITPCSGQRS